MSSGCDASVDMPTKQKEASQSGAVQSTKDKFQIALRFVKEWGGVATVLIGVLYTFPFDAAARIINWREHNKIEARHILSEVAALYAEETAAVEKIQDFRLKSFLANTYNIRIYNKLLEKREVVNAAANNLLPSELYMVGSLYTLSGLVNLGLPYYQLALK